MATANQQGVISNTSLIEAFGLDVDQEIERLRFEQGSAFMKDPNFGTPSFSLNLQSGPVTGQGFTAENPAGGAPMAPGAMSSPDLAGAGMAPPLASSKEKNYRLASSIVNSIYEESMQDKLKSDGKRFASVKIKSAAHEGFIKSIMPVTGRGIHGPLPDEYDGLGNDLKLQIFGGEFSVPLNYEAKFQLNSLAFSENEKIKIAAKAKMNMNAPKLYTKLEKQLYSLLLSLNMNDPLYAQYSAGPTLDYQLDAAIPNLGIGVEADGEIWHNNFEKITKDKKRDSELANNGWIILRFTDREINDHPQDVLNVIMKAIKQRKNNSSEGETDTAEIPL
jgi:very-short-patch-repair endonuclease